MAEYNYYPAIIFTVFSKKTKNTFVKFDAEFIALIKAKLRYFGRRDNS